jgi:predicted O-methyltransferase YrrM
MLDRTLLINKLINENGYKRYLEIGVGSGMNFNQVECKKKFSVDPNGNAYYTGTSDKFFEQNNVPFDIVFVDGLHLAYQAEKDTLNSLKVLRPGGVIVIHDCLPAKEERQFPERVTKNWQGDVWKAIVSLAHAGWLMKLLEIETGIVLLWPDKKKYSIPEGELTWDWFQKHFKNMLCG